MALTPQESQQLGRIEAKVGHIHDTLKEHVADETPRLVKLERHVSWVKGVLAVISVLFTIGCAFIIGGCAHSHTRTYFPDGKLKCNSATTVLGQGQVDVLVESDECPDTIYESNDTGLSDNGKDAIGEIAEGVAAGVVKGVAP